MANAKLDVDIGGFVSNITSAKNVLKGLDAEMKATDATFKATGNSEQQLANKTKTLNAQIQNQKTIVDQASQALKAMADAGVGPADAAYQKMYVTMMNATAGMNNAQAELNALAAGTQSAADGADKLSTSMQGIGKKISLEQVISGIDKITSGLENAARKAVKLGEDLWNSIMDSAQWADDTATQAQMFGIDLDTFQRMQKLVTNGLDTTLEAMLRSQQKFNNNIGKGADEFVATMVELGLATATAGGKTGETFMSLVTEDQLDLFFRAGQAIMGMTDAFEQENTAQKLFGRSWRELVPLFDTENGGFASVEEYNEALKNVRINSEEDVNALAELNDKVATLKGDFDTLSRDVMAQLAPALTDAATALDGLLQSVLDYLETEEGQEMLQGLGDSVSELFEGMKNINAEDVVNGFKEAFDKVMNVLNWIVNNKDAVVGALEGVFGFWATLKVSEGALTILQVINGLKDLAGIGAGGAGGTTIATGLGTMLTSAAGNVAGLLGNTILQSNIPVIGDWLTHEGPLGGLVNGTETWDDVTRNFENWQRDTFRNFENFFKDWGHLGDENYDFGSHEELKITPEVDVPVEDVKAQFEALDPEIKVKVRLDWQFGGGSGLPGVEGFAPWVPGFANGVSSVPYDGMLARLHKGERVVPAREVQSRNYSSNLYVESMIMNNNTDANGLASAMAAAQRRTMAGYGS